MTLTQKQIHNILTHYYVIMDYNCDSNDYT